MGPGQGGKIMLRGTIVLRMAKTTVMAPLFMNDDNLENNVSKSFNSSLNNTTVSIYETANMGLRLKYLDLSFATIQESCLESLFKKCRNLRKVALENCRLNETILFHLSQNKNLETLHMAMAVGVTVHGLCHLSQGLIDTLVDVNLGWIGMNEDMVEEAILLLGNNSRTLSRLNITGCRESLTDNRLEFILEHCLNLKELDVSDARCLTANAIKSIVCHSKHIEMLSCSRCFGIAAASYIQLENCPSLKYLNVFGVMKDGALEELKSYINSIDINKCYFSSIARPTFGTKRTSIWNQRTREL